jgi:hypothetical protein
MPTISNTSENFSVELSLNLCLLRAGPAGLPICAPRRLYGTGTPKHDRFRPPWLLPWRGPGRREFCMASDDHRHASFHTWLNPHQAIRITLLVLFSPKVTEVRL